MGGCLPYNENAFEGEGAYEYNIDTNSVSGFESRLEFLRHFDILPSYLSHLSIDFV